MADQKHVLIVEDGKSLACMLELKRFDVSLHVIIEEVKKA